MSNLEYLKIVTEKLCSNKKMRTEQKRKVKQGIKEAMSLLDSGKTDEARAHLQTAYDLLESEND